MEVDARYNNTLKKFYKGEDRSRHISVEIDLRQFSISVLDALRILTDFQNTRKLYFACNNSVGKNIFQLDRFSKVPTSVLN